MAYAYAMTISGTLALNQKLKQLASQAVTVGAARKGVREALRIMAERSKRSVPKRYVDARKTIAVNFKKVRTGTKRGEYKAKVGFGVGKREGQGDLLKQFVRRKKKGSNVKRVMGPKGKMITIGSVGISKRDIHWFVLGTKRRRTKSGANRGRMGPLSFAGVIKNSTLGIEKVVKKRLMEMVEMVRRG